MRNMGPLLLTVFFYLLSPFQMNLYVEQQRKFYVSSTPDTRPV